ncbi:MAG: sigma-70 family RNA polymerase sigma factor [candidate division Zixibacteria bacterium]|nr:sigma-70 family RNA polymerase sigma factor [candidate division Zixibacteria bacterium]
MNKSIPELVDSFVKGDTAAFAELVRRYQKNIYFLAYRLLGNHLDADDVVQETFVRVYRRQKEIANVNSFTSFLTRIATNYAIDLLRKRKGRGSVSDDLTELPGETQVDLARRVRTPEELLRDKVVMEEIQRALDRLPPRQRITIMLHDVDGYTKSEVAAILECPEATVRSNLHIARNKLKKILKKRLSVKE